MKVGHLTPSPTPPSFLLFLPPSPILPYVTWFATATIRNQPNSYPTKSRTRTFLEERRSSPTYLDAQERQLRIAYSPERTPLSWTLHPPGQTRGTQNSSRTSRTPSWTSSPGRTSETLHSSRDFCRYWTLSLACDVTDSRRPSRPGHLCPCGTRPRRALPYQYNYPALLS